MNETNAKPKIRQCLTCRKFLGGSLAERCGPCHLAYFTQQEEVDRLNREMQNLRLDLRDAEEARHRAVMQLPVLPGWVTVLLGLIVGAAGTLCVWMLQR